MKDIYIVIKKIMLSFKQIFRQISDKSSQKSLGNSYVKPLTGFRKYITNKLMKFVESYERILQKRFPSTFRVVQVFTFGEYYILFPFIILNIFS